jgi:hypothetical protein
MTYQEALQYRAKKLDTTWTRGYISRKMDTRNQPVIAAGGGRKGQHYVVLPSYGSTRYCVRQYLDMDGCQI